ncbi:MAG: exo-alpha-sialidase [Rhodospirillales bacterium]|nr:exo-alpha-sialidase [Rhodospirillales bacterium]
MVRRHARGHRDVGIWVARKEGAHWVHPIEVADGRIAFRRRVPCWNPVLFQPRLGPLLLFYKLGPSPSRWWGMMATSTDGGRTWSDSRPLPRGILDRSRTSRSSAPTDACSARPPMSRDAGACTSNSTIPRAMAGTEVHR